jgi:hypothetical protein
MPAYLFQTRFSNVLSCATRSGRARLCCQALGAGRQSGARVDGLSPQDECPELLTRNRAAHAKLLQTRGLQLLYFRMPCDTSA